MVATGSSGCWRSKSRLGRKGKEEEEDEQEKGLGFRV